MKHKKGYILDQLRHWAVLVFATIFVLFPYYWMVITSLKPREETMLSPTTWFPSRLDFNNEDVEISLAALGKKA